MKYIKKGAAPHELKKWFKGQPLENGRRLNCHYEDLESEVKDIIEKRLLEEQGWLCCYTGMSISETNFHIEHLIPRAVSRRQGTHEDVDYKNMMAAYPRVNNCPFGARVRGDKPLPVHPLRASCERKFRFDLEGGITGVDQDANNTIRCLKLDHDMLTQMRQAAIDEALFPKKHPLSKAKIQLVAKSYCTTNATGQYPRFCFVVAQAAQQYLQIIAREKKRQKAIRKQAKK